MIDILDFDYDTASLFVKADGEDLTIKVKSAFTPDAIQAAQYFSMCCEAAKEQGIALDEEVDNFGVKVSKQTETYQKLVAQYAEKLIADWPIDAPVFESLFDNQSLSWSIIRKSDERAKEFIAKKS